MNIAITDKSDRELAVEIAQRITELCTRRKRNELDVVFNHTDHTQTRIYFELNPDWIAFPVVKGLQALEEIPCTVGHDLRVQLRGAEL